MLPRPLTNSEMAVARQNFPQMMFSRVVVTAEANGIYNCLAWTLGASTWVWPWLPKTRKVTKAEFDALYKRYGLVPFGGAWPTIGVTGSNSANMLHGYRHLTSGIAMAESKLGPWLRVRHGIDDIMGGTYGWAMGDYKPGAMLDEKTDQPDEEPSTLYGLPEVPDPLHAAAREESANVSQGDRTAFEAAYAAWEKTWSEPALLVSSVPGDRTQSQEFRDLVALGVGIAPLLLEKALAPEHWPALLAAEAVTGEEPVRFELDDPRIMEGEQGRALETVSRRLGGNR